jgi:hypothetical protein
MQAADAHGFGHRREIASPPAGLEGAHVLLKMPLDLRHLLGFGRQVERPAVAVDLVGLLRRHVALMLPSRNRTMGEHRETWGKTVPHTRHEKSQREAGRKCEKCPSLLAF